ncbi:hypothetical protein BDR06DRAFT_65691 [Suillus hirtellus]|nr:hypothetical protein BDR06DRAFT_65691 [Suillus hirtellus]
MHLHGPHWVLFLVLVISMVSCSAPRCSWEKNTDSRGLSRHRSKCKYYQKASTLAMERRRERARELIQASHKSSQAMTSSTCGHGPIEFTNSRRSKPIASCEPMVSTSSTHPGLQVNRTSPARTCMVTLVSQDSDVLDITMEDGTRRERHIPADAGQQPSRRVPRVL